MFTVCCETVDYRCYESRLPSYDPEVVSALCHLTAVLHMKPLVHCTQNHGISCCISHLLNQCGREILRRNVDMGIVHRSVGDISPYFLKWR